MLLKVFLKQKVSNGRNAPEEAKSQANKFSPSQNKEDLKTIDLFAEAT